MASSSSPNKIRWRSNGWVDWVRFVRPSSIGLEIKLTQSYGVSFRWIVELNLTIELDWVRFSNVRLTMPGFWLVTHTSHDTNENLCENLKKKLTCYTYIGPVASIMNTVKVPTGRQDCSKSLAGNSSCFFFPAEFPDINHGVRKDFDVIIDNLLPNDVTLPQSLHDWQQTKSKGWCINLDENSLFDV